MQPCATLLALALALACARGGPVAVVHRADASTVSVDLEVVSTPAAMERGLMYRTSLPESSGMLFVFPEDADHSFWMKNTLIPLDMLFIARDGHIVGIHPGASPAVDGVDLRRGSVDARARGERRLDRPARRPRRRPARVPQRARTVVIAPDLVGPARSC